MASLVLAESASVFPVLAEFVSAVPTLEGFVSAVPALALRPWAVDTGYHLSLWELILAFCP